MSEHMGTLYPSFAEAKELGVDPAPMALRNQMATVTSDEIGTMNVTNYMDGSISIESEKTGRTFVMRSREVIDLALTLGVADASMPVAARQKVRMHVDTMTAVDDGRPVRGLYFPGRGHPAYRIGLDGVTSIVPYTEPGGLGPAMWYAVYNGDELLVRCNAAHAESVFY